MGYPPQVQQNGHHPPPNGQDHCERCPTSTLSSVLIVLLAAMYFAYPTRQPALDASSKPFRSLNQHSDPCGSVWRA
ncbi:hypothetical protein FKP32DRAFT_1670126, partial [Trametes sanguinea]